MKKLALIIPYFGKLPDYFQLFLTSCRYNLDVDFLLFTDDTTIYDLNIPSNTYVYIRSFDEIKQLFREKLNDNKLYLEIPYKLCDYKPTYGYVFQDYIKNYEYWGHCDIDLIFGDIMKFLNNINYKEYDRIFPYGHLSIYKNEDKINTIFEKELPFEYSQSTKFEHVKHTTYPCNFDESGVNVICRHFNYKFYESFFHLQVQDQQSVFRSQYKSRIPEIITFESGKVLSYKDINNTIEQTEFIYVHLQDRKIMPILIKDIKSTNLFLITHKGFIDFNREHILEYLKTYGANDTPAETKIYLKNRKRNEQKGRITKFVREIKTYKFKGIINILFRFYSIINRRKR